MKSVKLRRNPILINSVLRENSIILIKCGNIKEVHVGFDSIIRNYLAPCKDLISHVRSQTRMIFDEKR
jgi:hypothetical protein